MKVLVSDKLAPEGVDILKKAGLEVDCKYDLTPEQLKIEIKKYDAIVIRSGTTLTAEIIEAADKLRVIGRAGVGLDNVDLKAATKKGVVAMNTPAGNTTSTAEHTMSMLLSMSRNIPQAHMTVKGGGWDRNKFKGVEVSNKTIGIIGLGRIGSTVAKFAKGFDMKIIGFDPFMSAEVAEKRGITLVDLETIYKTADYITVHVPKTDETAGMIGDDQFAMMKKSARVINCARGGVIDEEALARALESGEIAGAAIDVYDEEPIIKNHPLLKFDSCILTPHLGASTDEAQLNVAIEIAHVVADALTGKGIRNAANFPSLSAEAYSVLEPYIDLGQKMGAFAGQLQKGVIQSIKIIYNGQMTAYKVAPITMAIANGLLAPALGEEEVNSLNALTVAKERGIDIEEIQSNKQEEFLNCVKLEIKSDKETLSVWGTLSSNNEARIVRVNDIYVEAAPKGTMIFINNNDKPGIVGTVGTILAEANINIASITLGRVAPGGYTISVVNVDGDVSEKIVKKLEANKDILFVKVITV